MYLVIRRQDNSKSEYKINGYFRDPLIEEKACLKKASDKSCLSKGCLS